MTMKHLWYTRVYGWACVANNLNIQYVDITKDNMETYTLASLNDKIFTYGSLKQIWLYLDCAASTTIVRIDYIHLAKISNYPKSR
jgi:hypothetical protein